MKKINKQAIIDGIADLCIKSATCLSEEVISSYRFAFQNENDDMARDILRQLIGNAIIGKEESIPVCQDTGMVICFVELGNKVQMDDFNLDQAINEGVRKGYQKGYLRKSIVKDPLNRINTQDNTPAIIYTNIIEGDQCIIRMMLKGFGSENMSQTKMLSPSQGKEGVVKFIKEVVEQAGPNPCPPLYIGIGIGGTMEMAGILSKKALFRKIGQRNQNEFYAQLEKELLTEINELDIGPGGFGGTHTALDVFVEWFPTHIAGLPVAVTLCCHCLRHGELVL